MKFSDVLIPWKKQNIAKNKLKYQYNNEFTKSQKEQYVQSALRDPDFDQTISEVNQRVIEHSTPQDQAIML